MKEHKRKLWEIASILHDDDGQTNGKLSPEFFCNRCVQPY